MKGLYDIHTHIIPHVDDGADTIEITKKILQMEYNDGMRTIFATSHFRRRMFETPMEKIRQQYLQVQQAAKEIAPDLRLILGCEFHANLDMVETLNAGKRPTMGDTRFVMTDRCTNGSFITDMNRSLHMQNAIRLSERIWNISNSWWIWAHTYR